MIWDVIPHNTLYCIEKGGLGVTIDETTWPNCLYSDMHKHLRGQKVNKGGHPMIVVDAQSQYVCMHATPQRVQKGREFTQDGQIRLKCLCKTPTPLVKNQPREEDDMRRQIFDKKPCLGMNNHFRGIYVDAYLGEEGYKAVMARHQRLLHRGLNQYM